MISCSSSIHRVSKMIINDNVMDFTCTMSCDIERSIDQEQLNGIERDVK